MKLSRLTLVLLLVAPSALAMNAPDGMRITKIKAGAVITGLPTASVNIDPKKQRPSEFVFHFRAGHEIAPALALDGTARGSNDPRLSEGNVTCSAFLQRNSMPAIAQLDERPLVGAQTLEFASGKSVTQTQAVFAFNTVDQFRTVTHNQLICYKVGSSPLTTADVRRALGPQAQIMLSSRQAYAIQQQQALDSILEGSSNGFSQSHVAPSMIAADAPVKVVAAPADPVTDQQTSGSFVSHPITQAQ